LACLPNGIVLADAVSFRDPAALLIDLISVTATHPRQGRVTQMGSRASGDEVKSPSHFTQGAGNGLRVIRSGRRTLSVIAGDGGMLDDGDANQLMSAPQAIGGLLGGLPTRWAWTARMMSRWSIGLSSLGVGVW